DFATAVPWSCADSAGPRTRDLSKNPTVGDAGVAGVTRTCLGPREVPSENRHLAEAGTAERRIDVVQRQRTVRPLPITRQGGVASPHWPVVAIGESTTNVAFPGGPLGPVDAGRCLPR